MLSGWQTLTLGPTSETYGFLLAGRDLMSCEPVILRSIYSLMKRYPRNSDGKVLGRDRQAVSLWNKRDRDRSDEGFSPSKACISRFVPIVFEIGQNGITWMSIKINALTEKKLSLPPGRVGGASTEFPLRTTIVWSMDSMEQYASEQRVKTIFTFLFRIAVLIRFGLLGFSDNSLRASRELARGAGSRKVWGGRDKEYITFC